MSNVVDTALSWRKRFRPLFELASSIALTMLTIAASGIVHAQPADLPPFSHEPEIRVGAMCDQGYRQSGGGCVVRKIPEHAFRPAWGDEWECERGFHRA
jgi:hypothetical protein